MKSLQHAKVVIQQIAGKVNDAPVVGAVTQATNEEGAVPSETK